MLDILIGVSILALIITAAFVFVATVWLCLAGINRVHFALRYARHIPHGLRVTSARDGLMWEATFHAPGGRRWFDTGVTRAHAERAALMRWVNSQRPERARRERVT